MNEGEGIYLNSEALQFYTFFLNALLTLELTMLNKKKSLLLIEISCKFTLMPAKSCSSVE